MFNSSDNQDGDYWYMHQHFQMAVLVTDWERFLKNLPKEYPGVTAIKRYSLRPGEFTVVGYDTLDSLEKFETKHRRSQLV